MDDQGADPSPDLHVRYREYRAAMAGWRAAARAEDPVVCEVAAERLLQARVALYRALVAGGWCAPAGVDAQLERDAALVQVSDDLDALPAR